MSNESNVGDLTDLAVEIVNVIKAKFGGNPAIGVCFTLEDDRKEVHWVTNVSRVDGVNLFQNTAKKMIAQTN
jgi:hypothetical protein